MSEKMDEASDKAPLMEEKSKKKDEEGGDWYDYVENRRMKRKAQDKKCCFCIPLYMGV